jgi:hypothetical protein
MEHFAGGSALDFMNLADNPELMKPQMPPELIGKTLAELKSMGATQIATIDTRSDVKFSGMVGMDTQLSPEAEENLRLSLKEMEDEDFDPDYFVDSLSDTKFEFSKDGDLK